MDGLFDSSREDTLGCEVASDEGERAFEQAHEWEDIGCQEGDATRVQTVARGHQESRLIGTLSRLPSWLSRERE